MVLVLSWIEKLSKLLDGKRAVFLCVGNDMKGDDALGKYVYDRLDTERKVYCAEMPENFIGPIRKMLPDIVVIIDAMDMARDAGSIYLASPDELDGRGLGTHSMPLGIMCEMLDSDIVVLGVQPKRVVFGEGLSDVVKKGGDEIVLFLNSQ
jgi:hydrogenase 3 maturation protease